MNNIKDIENVEKEFKEINKKLFLVNDRFLALAMDYKTHIDPNLRNDLIYELRDNVMYKLQSASFHFRLLLSHIQTIDTLIQKGSDTLSLPPYIDNYKNEITSILDSLVYHSISLFDYMSTLIHFVITKKTDTVKWASLIKKLDTFSFSSSKTQIAISTVNQKYVDNLYRYRSKIIHDRPDYGTTSYSISIGVNKASLDYNFYAGKILCKSFGELKNLSNDSRLTIKYVSFWIMQRNIETVNELLFALKLEIEAKNLNAIPIMLYKEPLSGIEYPASYIYWHADKK
jgi:hypothetical protein